MFVMRDGNDPNDVLFDKVHERVWIRREDLAPRTGEVSRRLLCV
jgi:hypothetical protein